MPRYVDRGNLEWIPFLMPEHKAMLKQYYREVHPTGCPELRQAFGPTD
ncbi:hypothetical protein [Exiguobacterium undae]|nr:hypothetical protein [Exiguobacterium undae]